MNRLTKTAWAAAAATLVSCGAQASFTANDLYLGFNSSSAQSDYIIDLGLAGLGGSGVQDLSGMFSSTLFNSTFTSGANGVNMGVVGGNPTYGAVDLFATLVRTGGPGNVAVAGSDLSGKSYSSGTLAGAAATLTGNPWPAAGSGVVDPSKSFTGKIGPALTQGDFYGKSGINPFGAFDSTSVLYEDLWAANPNSGYTYEGYFTMNLSGANPSLTFTPTAVPEPSTCSLLAGAGLLAVFFRNKLRPRQA